MNCWLRFRAHAWGQWIQLGASYTHAYRFCERCKAHQKWRVLS